MTRFPAGAASVTRPPFITGAWFGMPIPLRDSDRRQRGGGGRAQTGQGLGAPRVHSRRVAPIQSASNRHVQRHACRPGLPRGERAPRAATEGPALRPPRSYLTSIPCRAATMSSSSGYSTARVRSPLLSRRTRTPSTASNSVAACAKPRTQSQPWVAASTWTLLSCAVCKDHPPEIALHGMVDAVLRLVNEQEAVPAVREGQGGAEQAYRPVTEAFERDGMVVIFQPHDHPATDRCLPAPCAVSDHRDASGLLVRRQVHGLYHPLLIVRQGDPVPESRHLAPVRQPRPQGFAARLRWQLALAGLQQTHQLAGKGLWTRRQPLHRVSKCDFHDPGAFAHQPAKQYFRPGTRLAARGSDLNHEPVRAVPRSNGDTGLSRRVPPVKESPPIEQRHPGSVLVGPFCDLFEACQQLGQDIETGTGGVDPDRVEHRRLAHPAPAREERHAAQARDGQILDSPQSLYRKARKRDAIVRPCARSGPGALGRFSSRCHAGTSMRIALTACFRPYHGRRPSALTPRRRGASEAVVITGAAGTVIRNRGLQPGVVEIDGRRIAGGEPDPITRRLRTLYIKAARAGAKEEEDAG